MVLLLQDSCKLKLAKYILVLQAIGDIFTSGQGLYKTIVKCMLYVHYKPRQSMFLY